MYSRQSINQLEELFNRESANAKHRNVLRYFLFSCYTGLRYSDIANLTFADINNGIITVVQEKTKERVSIPVIEKARKYLEEGKPYEKCFRVLSNQKTNFYLKEIMKLAGIKKTISFHCARHTFATISIEAGIPIDIVSKLLGHNSLKTTEIYTKYSDSLKIKEMNKLQSL